MQLAEEVLKGNPVEGEERGGEGESVSEGRAAFEGMESLARAIETGKVILSTCDLSECIHTHFVF